MEWKASGVVKEKPENESEEEARYRMQGKRSKENEGGKCKNEPGG